MSETQASSSTVDLRSLVDERNMSFLQYSTIFVCFLMNMLDGMDIMIVSYSASSIASTWDIKADALGIVFSAGLLGMTIGTMFLAPWTDVVGRRPMILFCAALMGVSVFVTSFSATLYQLILLRFLSGLGIGGMLASTPALASEYAPNRIRDFCVSFVMSGYPVGATITGLVAAEIVPKYGWTVLFQVAGVCTLLTIPLIYFFAAESLDFLFKSRPKNALGKANRLLHRMGVSEIDELPVLLKTEEVPRASIKSLFSGSLLASTLLLWLAFFMSYASLYFLVSWIPKLAESAGLSLQLAIYAGAVFNLGSFFGIALQGYLSSRLGLSRVISVFLAISALLMVIFGLFKGSDLVLVLFGLIGFTFQGGFAGLFAVAARLYPTQFRTTGIGWAIGVGRSGGIVGPYVGGILIAGGLSMAGSFIVFAIPIALSAMTTLYISSRCA